MPMKRRFEIIPIVESEIVPDQSLELIKGGGYTTVCESFSCARKYKSGTCEQGFGCYIFCWQCKELEQCTKYTIPPTTGG